MRPCGSSVPKIVPSPPRRLRFKCTWRLIFYLTKFKHTRVVLVSAANNWPIIVAENVWQNGIIFTFFSTATLIVWNYLSGSGCSVFLIIFVRSSNDQFGFPRDNPTLWQMSMTNQRPISVYKQWFRLSSSLSSYWRLLICPGQFSPGHSKSMGT